VAGTPLKGLGFIKGQEAPLAKDDGEYPHWLWGLLGTGDKSGELEGASGDLFGESKLFCLHLFLPFRQPKAPSRIMYPSI